MVPVLPFVLYPDDRSFLSRAPPPCVVYALLARAQVCTFFQIENPEKADLVGVFTQASGGFGKEERGGEGGIAGDKREDWRI